MLRGGSNRNDRLAKKYRHHSQIPHVLDRFRQLDRMLHSQKGVCHVHTHQTVCYMHDTFIHIYAFGKLHTIERRREGRFQGCYHIIHTYMYVMMHGQWDFDRQAGVAYSGIVQIRPASRKHPEHRVSLSFFCVMPGQTRACLVSVHVPYMELS